MAFGPQQDWLNFGIGSGAPQSAWQQAGVNVGSGFGGMGMDWLRMLMERPDEYRIRRAFAGGPLSDEAYAALSAAQPGIPRDVVGEQMQRVQESFEGGGAQPSREQGGGAIGRLQSWGAQSGMGRSGAYSDALRSLGTEETRQIGTVGQEQADRLAALNAWNNLFGGAFGGGGGGGAAAGGAGGNAFRPMGATTTQGGTDSWNNPDWHWNPSSPPTSARAKQPQPVTPFQRMF